MDDSGSDAHPRFYKDMVEYHDKVIGRLLDYLAEQGLSEDTLVIYTGDNGSPQEVCSVMHRHNEICGGKGKTNDQGTHVPLIAQMPGTVPAGVANSDLIDVTDFLPTMMDVAGVEAPEGYVIDGTSFYPQLRGETGDPKDWLFFHFQPMSPNVAADTIRFVRDREWKLYETGELYDLNADLDEEMPIFESQDGEKSAAARAKLKPVFAEMV